MVSKNGRIPTERVKCELDNESVQMIKENNQLKNRPHYPLKYHLKASWLLKRSFFDIEIVRRPKMAQTDNRAKINCDLEWASKQLLIGGKDDKWRYGNIDY